MREVEIVFLVAYMEPATSREIADMAGEPIGNATNGLVRAWRNGYLVRRDVGKGSHGGSKYEYALAPPERKGWG